MNYCRFRNETIKRMANAGGGLLPAEYQQVEYLQSNNSSSNNYGSDWIHIDTGVNYFADFEIECNKTINEGTIFAGCGLGLYGSYGATVGRYSSAQPYATFFASTTKYYISGVQVTTRGKYKWKNNKVFVNDVEASNLQKPSSTYNFFLFGYTGEYSYGYSHMRFYSAKLWDNNGEIIRDYIPCYRKADNTPGMFDIVTRTFNPGTGTSGYFTVGNNV